MAHIDELKKCLGVIGLQFDEIPDAKDGGKYLVLGVDKNANNLGIKFDSGGGFKEVK